MVVEGALNANGMEVIVLMVAEIAATNHHHSQLRNLRQLRRHRLELFQQSQELLLGNLAQC